MLTAWEYSQGCIFAACYNVWNESGALPNRREYETTGITVYRYGAKSRQVLEAGTGDEQCRECQGPPFTQ